MAKFVLIYNGGTPPQTDEEKDRVMAAWGQWFEGIGDALVDPGNPFGPPHSIGGEATEPVTGYSIVQADDQTAAAALVENHPMVSEDGTRIDIYEAFPM